MEAAKTRVGGGQSSVPHLSSDALKKPPSPVGPVRRAQQSSEEMFHLQRTTRQSITDGKKEKSSFRMWISRYQDIADIFNRYIDRYMK